MPQRTDFEHSIAINAPASVVWEALTNPELMRQWMGAPEMALEIQTEWAVGSPMVIRGHLHEQIPASKRSRPRMLLS